MKVSTVTKMTQVSLFFSMAGLLLAQNPITLSVSASMDIWQSGGYNDGSDGVPPATYTFPAAPGLVIMFSSVTGDWSCGGAAISVSENGPDGTNTGNCFGDGAISISPTGPFSGLDLTDFGGPLVGMFLADSLPVSTPSTARFYWSDSSQGGIQTNFTALSPQIGQVFFIGDGLTGTGTGAIQVFNVPPTATHLYLGYADYCNDPGPPGCYVDNFGSLTATFAITTVAPPSPVVLIVPGIFGTKLASASEVVWLSNETIYDTVLNGQDLNQLEYDSTGQPTTALSVQALNNGTDYGGLFNLSSESGTLQYELVCSDAVLTYFFLNLLSSQDCYKDFNVYNNLTGALTAKGFTYDVFPYDWREDIAQLAEQLNQQVNTLIAEYPGRQLSLVAHSMGGLIVGEMFANYGVSPLISHVITLGTPFLGSVETYFEFRGWSSFYPGISAQESAQIGANWTAAYELLPQWPFVILQNGVPPILSVYDGTYLSWFPALPRSQGPNSALPLAVNVWQAERTVPAIPQAYAIIGSGQSTLAALTDTLSQGTCLQGETGNGDGMVPLGSALGGSWVPSDNVGFVNEQHLWLPGNNDVVVAILQILNGYTPTTLSKTPFGVAGSVTGCEN